MIGIMPMVIPMLMKMWSIRIILAPVARYMPKRSRARVAILMPFNSTIEYSVMINSPPTKPVSSAKTEKMKSFWATVWGR